MAAVAAGAAVVGTLVTMEGQRQASAAQAAAAANNAKLKRLQALELLDRFDINAQQLFKEGEVAKAQQQLSLASRGVDVGSASALSVINESNATILREFVLQRREAEYKAEQLRAGADIDQQLSGDIAQAGRTQRTGTFLSGVGLTARQFK